MILGILAAIGSVLLKVLIVAVIIIALILFFPVSYKAHVEKHDKLTADGKVGWLFDFLKFAFSFENNKFNYQIKILGITIKRSGGKDKEKEKKEEYKPAKKQPTISPGEKTEAYRELKKQLDIEAAAYKEGSYDYNDGRIRRLNEDVFAEEAEPGFTERISSRINKLRGTMDSAGEIMSMVKRIWPDLKNIIRHIAPRRINGHIDFGFEDPSTTGYLLGILGMLALPIPEELEINPDFTRSVFETDVSLKGRLFIIFVLIQAIKIIRDPGVRELLGKRFPIFRKDKKK